MSLLKNIIEASGKRLENVSLNVSRSKKLKQPKIKQKPTKNYEL